MSTRTPLPCKILRQLPYGLLIELENGERGLVREREIAWDAAERRRWRQQLTPGTPAQVVPLLAAPGGVAAERQLPEFSLRQAQYDPWQTAPARFQNEPVTLGEVTGAMPYGVFIEIAPGLTGLLHASELPEELQRHPEEAFWPGDHVRVSVEHIDPKRQRIELKLAVQRLDTGGLRAASLQPPAPQAALAPENQPEPPDNRSPEPVAPRAQTSQPPQSILIVEDQEPQAAALKTWFEKSGHPIFLAANAAEGLAQYESYLPDLAIIDLGLPDATGIAVVEQVLARWPEARCVIVSDWARALDMDAELEPLRGRGVGLLIKPLRAEDLTELVSGGRTPTAPAAAITSQPAVPARPAQANPQLHAILEDCRKQLGFDLAVLFCLDPARRTVELVQRSGAGLNRTALAALVYSPVRDIAEDGKQVVLERLEDRDLPRFRHLLELYSLQACLGVPATTSTARRYALLLLHSAPHRIPPDALAYARAAALTLGAALERQAVQEQAIQLQRFTLLGQVSGMLVHEMNNRIATLTSSVSNLDEVLKRLRQAADSGQPLEKSLDRASQYMATLGQSVSELVHTTHLARTLTDRPGSGGYRVEELVGNAVTVLQNEARKAGVRLVWRPPNSVAMVRGQGLALEQALINVLLNAVQQTGALHNERGGWVQAHLETLAGKNGEPLVRILVQDNGPGIHHRLWEQIFEIGFTTRTEGGGLGLYIARSLLEAIGGRLYVAESAILGGSSFALELPWQSG